MVLQYLFTIQQVTLWQKREGREARKQELNFTEVGFKKMYIFTPDLLSVWDFYKASPTRKKKLKIGIQKCT